MAIEDLQSFRMRLREWLEESMPRREESSYSGVGLTDWDAAGAAAAKILQRKLYDGGFAGLLYPKEYGGQGLGRDYQAVFNEEARDYEMPLIFSVSLGNVGPTILDFGTEEQKQRYIPGILRGDELWVQYLSEPGGGSDLAGCSTTAARDGDIYLINGSKIWSTGADASEFALCLARTDWDVPKHRGLSMLIIPIPSEGMTIQPVILSNGTNDFCQEFLDDVSIPVENLLGEENDGWTVASRLLVHERSMNGGTGLDGGLNRARRSGSDTLARVEELVASVAPERRRDIEEIVGEAHKLSRMGPLLGNRITEAIKSGELNPQASSIVKYFASTSEFRIAEIALIIAGEDGEMWEDEGSGSSWGENWIAARRSTVAGGTSEIQLNVISERVLGLPRDVGPDRDIPYRLARRNVSTTDGSPESRTA